MKNNNIPKLRYPEFTDAWEKCKLGEVVNFFSGLTYSPGNIVDDGVLVIRSSNIQDGELINRDNVYVIPEYATSPLVKIGDVIVVVRNGSRDLIGKHAQVKNIENQSVIGAFMTGIRYDIPEFINALLDTPQFKIEINKNLGATINQITMGEFKKMLFTFPTLPEQQKIGALFKQLDRLITLHKRKWDDVILLKKALLQKMFPKNGSDFPALRFPEFTDAWEKCKLGEVADFLKGNGYSKNDLVKNGKQVILYGRLYTNYQAIIDDIDTFVIEKEKSIVSTGNEVLVPASGETAEEIARASALEKSGIILGGDLNIIKIREKISPHFLAITLSNGSPKQELSKKAQGKSVVHLRNSDLEKIIFFHPTLPEQQKIGTLFRRLDRLITLHKRQHEHYQLLKKALLQQMFV